MFSKSYAVSWLEAKSKKLARIYLIISANWSLGTSKGGKKCTTVIAVK